MISGYKHVCNVQGALHFHVTQEQQQKHLCLSVLPKIFVVVVVIVRFLVKGLSNYNNWRQSAVQKHVLMIFSKFIFLQNAEDWCKKNKKQKKSSFLTSIFYIGFGWCRATPKFLLEQTSEFLP